jgi:hypothetical protein
MIRYYPNEIFKEIDIKEKLKFKYAISNRGRLVSFIDDIRKGNELKGGLIDGYRIFRYKYRDDEGALRNKHFFFYKLIAEYFISKTEEDQNHVIHLDYVRNNDAIANLRWVNYADMLIHINKSPKLIENRKKLIEFNLQADGKKLTVTKVMRLKKMLKRPERKTRNKMIAKQFNISETQLKRIEKGENWGHIKV